MLLTQGHPEAAQRLGATRLKAPAGGHGLHGILDDAQPDEPGGGGEEEEPEEAAGRRPKPLEPRDLGQPARRGYQGAGQCEKQDGLSPPERRPFVICTVPTYYCFNIMMYPMSNSQPCTMMSIVVTTDVVYQKANKRSIYLSIYIVLRFMYIGRNC